MLDRIIADGIPVYVDKTTNIAYIYDTKQIRIGTYDPVGKHLLRDEGWEKRVAERFAEWNGGLEIRSRNTK